jgi:hypothetical protein
MAIKTIRTSRRKLNRQRAAEIYKIPETIFRARIAGRLSCSDTRLVVQNLTKLEKIIIVNHILDRDSRGFSPRQADIKDIANWLRNIRRAKPISKF